MIAKDNLTYERIAKFLKLISSPFWSILKLEQLNFHGHYVLYLCTHNAPVLCAIPIIS